MKGKSTIILVGIIFLAAFIRFYHLASVPPSLFGDEVDVGYNAYSILKIGKDITGHFLPIYLQTFIDTKAPLLAYFSTVPIHFLGLNEISIRLIPAIAGVMIVIINFFITLELFKDKTTALVAAFFTATAPWAIHFSRGVFEANLMLFLLVFGIYLFLKSVRIERLLIFSMVTFSLSFYAYHSAKILTPLIMLGLIFLFKDSLRRISRKKIVFGTVTFFLLSLPILYASIFLGGQNRFLEVSLFADREIINSIILKRQSVPDSSFSSRFFHNKGEAYLNKFLANYLESFSPQFLFLYGDPNFRHHVGGVGEIYPIYLPLFLIGLFFLIKEGKTNQKFLLYWLLISPLPSAITKDGGQHAIRLLFMMPVILVISAFGFYKFIIWVKKIFNKTTVLLIYIFLVVTFLLSLSFYLHQYFVHYPKESWRYWAYGYKEAMLSVKELGSKYDTVIINNSYEPSILWFLFWMNYEPNELLKTNIKSHFQENILPGVNGFRLGKYFFITPAKPGWRFNGVQEILRNNKNILFLASARDDTGDKDLRDFPLLGIRVLKTITNPYNQPIFYLLTSNAQ